MDPLAALLDGLDRGLEAHLAWNQRLLRCALLRESPGDDVLRPNAHELCRFGAWFATRRRELGAFDDMLVERIADAHQAMHAAVRALCARSLHGSAASAADLQDYEQGQSTMVAGINALRARIGEAVTRNDALTGLPLRHGLNFAFDLRCKDARRGAGQLWLAMIDVDHFKAVNDTHGHAVGDLALQHIARHLAARLRETDTLVRYGGEEFLALLRVPDQAGVELLAARLLDAVSAQPLTTGRGATVALTVTIGLARVLAGEELDSATRRADHALLQGKLDGRNRVVIAPG